VVSLSLSDIHYIMRTCRNFESKIMAGA
jgi:hypothetical protein